MKKIAVLPSMLTLANLLCGLYALRYAAAGQYSEGSFVAAAWMVLLAMVFDALDGKVARLTGASSRFGSELDSLADVVSFGVAPAFLVLQMSIEAGLRFQRLVWLCCIVYVLCAALRLARFNVETGLDEESHQSFFGLPSPPAAGQVVSLVILHHHLAPDVALIGRLLPAVCFFTGILMVSRARYPHLVSRFLSGRHAFAEIVFLAVAGVLVVLHSEFTLAAGFTVYTAAGVLGVAHHLVFHRGEGKEEPVF
jgi:CDP-diacylglycerol--serine O-phosphatidyltransferase